MDPGPLPEPTAHQYQFNTLTPAMCMVNLVVIVAYVCPNGAKACWFTGQVLVPLTSLNAHTADVRSLWASPLFMCEKLKLLSDTDFISLAFFFLFI